jgi:hypothetical protein
MAGERHLAVWICSSFQCLRISLTKYVFEQGSELRGDGCLNEETMGSDHTRDEVPDFNFVFLHSAESINEQPFGSDKYPDMKFSIRGGGVVMIKSSSISAFH